MTTQTSTRSGIRFALGAALSTAAFVLASIQTAKAESPGSCPGADVVETSLQNGNSSGYYIPGLRLIILNQAILVKYAPSVRQFILAHECAHSNPAVGEDESKADCAATKQGINEGWLTEPDLIKVCVHLSRFPADATHPPIGVRCANIRQCARDAQTEIAQSRKQWPEKEIARTPLMARNIE